MEVEGARCAHVDLALEPVELGNPRGLRRFLEERLLERGLSFGGNDLSQPGHDREQDHAADDEQVHVELELVPSGRDHPRGEQADCRQQQTEAAADRETSQRAASSSGKSKEACGHTSLSSCPSR